MIRKHPLANCEECPLAEGGKFCASTGPEQADIAFVGEAPGVQEARTGQPFIGPSGRLLDLVMDYHGIKRNEVFLTNATLCRAPDGQAPPKGAIAACRPRLVEELKGRVPSVIIPLGNTAAQSILRTQVGITQLRVGPGQSSEEFPGVRIIPTVHPAACLRQSDMFPSLATDIGKVVAKSELWSEPEWKLFDTPVEAIKVLRELEQRASDLVVDIEVDIEKDTAFDHPNNYGLLCVGLSHATGKAVVIGEHALEDRAVVSALGDCLRASRIIAQNGKFDLAGLYPHVGKLTLYFDTMLASYVLDERPGVHGLKHMAVEYLGAPKYDEEIKKYVGPKDGYGVIPRDLLYRYNAYDAVCTMALYEMFTESLHREDLRGVHDFLVAASNQLMFVELNGLAVDIDYLDQLTGSYLDVLSGIETDINNILAATHPSGINPRSPKQVKEVLAELKVNVASTNEETLRLILEKVNDDTIAHAFVTALLRHRREAKLYGTYIKGIRKRLYQGKVHPTFLLHGTTTGRLSCRNPNLQNVPRESTIRDMFVPTRSDRVFVQLDYSQAELRVLTYLARDEYFRGIFNDPSRDLFDELTPVLYPRIDPKKVSPVEYKELRIRVKAFVYGLSYGREYFSIAQEFKISSDEARQLQSNFFKVIPSIVAFRQKTIDTVMANEDLITPFGRHRRFWLVTNDNKKSVENEALAFLPQSTASDICLGAFTKLRPELVGKAFIRNLVHDSLLAECHKDDAEEVAAIMDKRMVESAQSIVGDYVAFKTDYKIGHTWGQV